MTPEFLVGQRPLALAQFDLASSAPLYLLDGAGSKSHCCTGIV
jgi:hypothetical protein